MSRDFLVKFKSEDSAFDAFKILSSLEDDNGTKFFDSIDNRGKGAIYFKTYPEKNNRKNIF